MTLYDMAKNVDTSKDNRDYPDIVALLESLGIYESCGDFDKIHDIIDIKDTCPIKFYWLSCWKCTDTTVGIGVYYFNDYAVAVGKQLGRKLDMCIEWMSSEAVDTVRSWALKIIYADRPRVQYVNKERNFDDYYTLDFPVQLLRGMLKYATYKGMPFTIPPYGIKVPDLMTHQKCRIIPYGETKPITILMKDIHFPVRVKGYKDEYDELVKLFKEDTKDE